MTIRLLPFPDKPKHIVRLLGLAMIAVPILIGLSGDLSAATLNRHAKQTKPQAKLAKPKAKNANVLVKNSRVLAKPGPVISKKQVKPKMVAKKAGIVTAYKPAKSKVATKKVEVMTARQQLRPSPVLSKMVAAYPAAEVPQLERTRPVPIDDVDRPVAKEACFSNGKIYLLADCRNSKLGHIPLASTRVSESSQFH